MRASRLVIVGLSGLVALHIFMLAGHGHGHDPFAGMRGVSTHAADGMSPSLATATDGDEGGMHLEMTVACLAVVAGLLLLQPTQRRQTTPSQADQHPYLVSGPRRPRQTSNTITRGALHLADVSRALPPS